MSACGYTNGPAIKVCGLTRKRDVQLCLDLGVDFTGFIFVPESPRYIPPAVAAGLPTGSAARVGVFAGLPAQEIVKIMKEARLDFAQLHGGEEPDACLRIGAERVIKVLWPERLTEGTNENAITALERECERFAPVCSLFLLDAGTGGGGSGREQSRTRLKGFCPSRPWFLAGGLGPDNAATALAECSPFGLDCNSGVESAPGVKDPSRLKALLHTLSR